ncbi:MAG: ABC transporter ATP-binding protein [Hyphomicrobiales bacterium]|nr:ABC transporter ATP-binding protein [Hyphomicrobiales bacterium]
MSDPVLELEHLQMHFGALHVTRDVSIEVRPGEVHALIGPNGAGKTTLISQISGQLQPHSGSVILAGENITQLSVAERARRGLSRVFQISNVIQSYSALANVVLAIIGTEDGVWWRWRPALSDTSLADRAMNALAQVGLADKAQSIASDLSYGERRALELAITLAQNPRLLLLDEPMAGVGREESGALTKLLASLKGRVSMLLIEHDMNAVFALADRLTVLIGGAVALTGPPAEIKASPLVRQAYLGEEIQAATGGAA